MSKTLKNIKDRFIKSMGEVNFITGIPIPEIMRDDYIRIMVDMGIKGRLNKEELNLLGGFKQAKQTYFKPEALVRHIQQPKVLIADIETAPMKAYVWGLWDNNVSLNQIVDDWSIISWSAKWLGEAEDKVMYDDLRGIRNIKNDKKLIKGLWKLLNEADILITQNGIKFDVKKLNARFVHHGMMPPSTFKQIDTLVIAKKYFSFTSNKLEYMTDKLCTKYKKLKHGKFPGMEMWTECLKDNLDAWKEMEVYNRYDVLSLEELYYKLIPWDNSIDFNLYHDVDTYICKCGSTEFNKSGYFYNVSGRFQKYKCIKCGSETRDTTNLFSDDKKKSLRRKI